VDGKHREPVVQVLAEPARHVDAGLLEVDGWSRQTTRTSTFSDLGCTPPTRSISALLQDAQQLGLQGAAAARRPRRGTTSPRAPRSNRPGLLRDGARERAPARSPNSSAFQQRLRDRAAVHLARTDRSRRAALRSWMRRARRAPCRSPTRPSPARTRRGRRRDLARPAGSTLPHRLRAGADRCRRTRRARRVSRRSSSTVWARRCAARRARAGLTMPASSTRSNGLLT
jgi:hypothetical protein